VTSQNPLADGAQAFDGTLRTLVSGIGFQLYAKRSERLERVPQKKELRLRVDPGALIGSPIPRCPDLEPAISGPNVEITRRAGDQTVCAVDDRERDLVSGCRSFLRVDNVTPRVVDRHERRPRKELPDRRVAADREQSLGMRPR